MPFSKNDPNINREGAPTKDWTWGNLLVQEADKIDSNDPEKKQKLKYSIVKKILAKANEGDVQAFREIANRTDGMPRETKDIKVSLPKPIMEIDGIQQDDSDN